MGQAHAVGLVVVVCAGCVVPEVRGRARYAVHHVVGRQQAQLALGAVAEAAAVAHLDRFPGDVVVVTAIDDLGHGVAVEHAIQHALGHPIPADAVQLLTQVVGCGLVDRAIAARVDLPLAADHCTLALLPHGLDLPVAQQLLVDLDVCADLAQQRVGGLRQRAHPRPGDVHAVAASSDLLAECWLVHQ